MTKDRAPTALFAIGWLFLLHGLADIMVGIYRCHDVDRALTDLLTASLMRSQLCLLAIWLVAGTDRLSWRISGLIAGSCFVFIVFSRFVFPGPQDIVRDIIWLDEEWEFYFRLSGPGDLLIKAPILIVGVVAPLLAWRFWRAIRSVRQSGLPRVKLVEWLRFQFRLQDVAIWVVTLSLALAAVYRTSPYPDWYGDLFERWRPGYRLESRPDTYCVVSAILYVLVAFVSLWTVQSKMTMWFRMPIAAALVIGPGLGFETWLRSIAHHSSEPSDPRVWSQATGETSTCVLAAAVMIGSLLLVRLYGMVAERRRGRQRG